MNYRKFAAITLAAMMAASPVASLAEYDPNKEIDPNVASTKMVKPVFAITVNGALLEDANVYVSGEHVMIPLRKVCEALGYEVTWNEEAKRIEIIRLPHYITLTQCVDGYTFARTAPIMLGKASEVQSDVTYVPSTFVSEILMGEIEIAQSGEITITQTGEQPAEEEITQDVPASMPEAVTEVGENSITVESSEWGEVILNISEETILTDANGETITIADIVVGDMLEVEFGDVMGMSEPPVNNPVSITLLPALDPGMAVMPDAEVMPEYLELSGTVVEFDAQTVQVTVLREGMEDAVTNYVVLNLGSQTIVRNDKGETLAPTALEAGDKIDARHSTIMTMSLPGQSPCYMIEVDTDGVAADFSDIEINYATFFDEAE